jgi:hypothetical protein
MKFMRGINGLAIAVAILGGGAPAWADDPKFDYGKPPEEKKETEWKVQAKGGLLLTTGNARALSMSAGFLGSRRDKWTKLTLDAGATYAQADLRVAHDDNNDMVISAGEDARETKVTSNAWYVKGRFDLFFTTNNAVYLSASVAGDQPAGKELFAGGQIGYARTLFKNDVHELVAEVGYDFTYERYVAKMGDGVQIHSARLFAGYNVKISDGTSAYLNFEALSNLNSENAPNANDADPTKPVGPLIDTRLTAKAGVATKLWKNFALSVGGTLKYDNNPAPRPPLSLPFAPGYAPFADKLDTILEAALIVDFV